MNKRCFFCRRSGRLLVSALVFVLVLTSVIISFGIGTADNSAYAEVGDVKLMLQTKEDKLNDRIEISVILTEMPDSGISGMEFRLAYPKEFNLEDKTDAGVIGNKFEVLEGSNPYYIAFGNMNPETGGIYRGTGEIAKFVFTLKNGNKLTADEDCVFKITSASAVVFEVQDNVEGESAQSKRLTVDFSEATSIYNPIESDTTGNVEGNITVKKPEEGVAKIKTETIREAVLGASSENIVLDMKSTSTADSKEQIIISREGAQHISDTSKNLIIKTDAGQLGFDKDALMTLKSNAEDTPITISIEKKADKDSKDTSVNGVMNISISAISSDKYIKDCGSGIITVDIDIPSNLQNQKSLTCMLYDLESGQYKMMEGIISEDSKVYSFQTNKLSEYMIGLQGTLDSYVKDNELKQGVTISGQVQSYNPKNETVIVLQQAGEEKFRTVISAETGSGQQTQKFKFEAVPTGTYDLVVTKAGHLTYTIKDIIVGDDDIDLTAMTGKPYQTITLLAGDVDGDGWINSTDLGIVLQGQNYGKQAFILGTTVEADIDGDGWVNSTDLGIILQGQHYGKADVSIMYN